MIYCWKLGKLVFVSCVNIDICDKMKSGSLNKCMGGKKIDNINSQCFE